MRIALLLIWSSGLLLFPASRGWSATVDVFCPIGGAHYLQYAPIRIQWTATGSNIDYFRVARTHDNGQNWTGIGPDIPASQHEYTYTPTGTGDQYRFRVKAFNSIDVELARDSTGLFSVETIPPLTLTSPLGGAQFLAGVPMDIIWSDVSHTVNNYALTHSTDGGVTWLETMNRWLPCGSTRHRVSCEIASAVAQFSLWRIGSAPAVARVVISPRMAI